MPSGQNAATPAPSEPPKHPATIDGIAVIAARRAEPPPGRENEPTYTGRTILLLENGRTRNGCADCDFTDRHWSAIVGHRTREHGAPVPTHHQLRGKKSPHTQLELAPSTDTATPPGAAAGEPTAQPAPIQPAETTGLETIAAAQMPPPAPKASKTSHPLTAEAVMDMTIREVQELAGSINAAGDALERITKEKDKWKAEALARRRAMATVDRMLGKVHSVVSEKNED